MNATLISLMAAGIGAIVTALTGLAVVLINRSREEGGLRADLKNFGTNLIEISERVAEAHERLDNITRDHHSLRETLAKEYVTYERMRELKTELSHSMDKLTTAYTSGMAALHVRFDQLIHRLAIGTIKEEADS